MNTEVEAIKAKDHMVEDSHATGATHATPKNINRTFQQFLAKAEVYA